MNAPVTAPIRLRSLTAADVRVLGTAVAGAGVYEACKGASPLPALIRRFEPPSGSGAGVSPERAAALVTAALRRLYGERFCLPRALVLYRLLGGAAGTARLHTGVRTLGSTLDGHAWVTLDGIAVGEPAGTTDRFAVTFSYPSPSLTGTVPDDDPYATDRAAPRAHTLV